MSFLYFCVVSCNNNAISVGFSLICLESLGILQRNWKSFANFFYPLSPPLYYTIPPLFTILPLIKKIESLPFCPILRKSIPSPPFKKGEFELCLSLTGIRFQGELQHVGDVIEQKFKCRPIRTTEIVGVRLQDELYQLFESFEKIVK